MESDLWQRQGSQIRQISTLHNCIVMLSVVEPSPSLAVQPIIQPPSKIFMLKTLFEVDNIYVKLGKLESNKLW